MESSGHGKQFNQKMKPLLVYNYLLQNTDDNHFASAETIVGYLQEQGISAERRSIYKDIEEINKLMLMIRDDCTLEEAEESLDYDEEEKTVRYMHKKGFYVHHTDYSLDDIRLIAEAIYAARFIDSKQTESLLELLRHMISDYEAEKVFHDVMNTDYSKTANTDAFFYVETINKAMSHKLDGYPHEPEKISFKYVKHSINDMKQTVAKRGGEPIIVSPYKLIINDGNYYLRCFDDKNQRMQNYRVDRMKDVKRIGVPRDGKDAADKEDYKSYNQRVFGMYGGKKEYISLKFTMSLLDTVVERFGKEKIKYHQLDAHHFSVMTEVETSPQFYAWLSGFGASVEIMAPDNVRNEYRKHLKEILKKYE